MAFESPPLGASATSSAAEASSRRCVLFLHRGGTQIRGSEQCLLMMLRGLDRERIYPLVLCNQATLAEEVQRLGVEVEIIQMPEIMIDRTVSMPMIGYLRTLRRLLRTAKANRARLLYCNGGGPCQLAVPVGRLMGIPVMCHFHHPAPKRYYYFWLLKWVKHLVFPSEHTRNHSSQKAHLWGTVIYNGVDTDYFTPAPTADVTLRRSMGFADDMVVVGQVGALYEHKGHRVLLAGFARACVELDNLRLVIVGEGPDRSRLERLADDLGIADKVTFTGYVEAVLPYYAQVLDIHVLASREEGLGISIIEAGACGVPSIGTDCTGIREVIRDGETGYLFPLQDEERLAELIVGMARDGDVRRRLGDGAMAMMRERFNLNKYSELLNSAIDVALDDGRRRDATV